MSFDTDRTSVCPNEGALSRATITSLPSYGRRKAFQKALELRLSEDELRAFINTIPTPAWSCSSDGSAESFNRRWMDYTGLSAEEALSCWKAAIHPDDLPHILEILQASFGSGQPFDVEGRLRRFDGEFRRFLFRGNPLRDESGRIVNWYGTITDLEEPTRTDDALRESEQSLRLTVDSIPGQISVLTEGGEVELLNRQILEYHGKTSEELKDWTTSDAVHPDDLPQTIAAWRHSVETGHPYDVDLRLRRADGVYRWFHLRRLSQRDAQGQIVRWYNLLTDIEDRKRAEEDLRRSEAYLSTAQKLSHTGSFGWNVSGGEIYWSHWSRETFRIFEYEPTTKVTIDLVLQRTHPEDRSAVEQGIERVLRDRTDFDFEHRLLMPDGSVKYLRVVGGPSKDESGCLEFVGAVTDITELHRLGRELQHERDRLRLLLDLNNRVALHLDLREVFLAVSSELRRVFKCDFVGLALPDGSGEYLRQHMVDFPESKGLLKEGELYPMEASCAGLAFRSAKPVLLNNLPEGRSIWSSDQAFYRRVTDEGPFQSGTFLPLIREDRNLGVLQLTSRSERSFAEQDVEFLGEVANQIAITLTNALEYERVAETKDRLHEENLALREQIDQAFMFEEIVGSSPVLKTVLTNIVKVAPTDSTVLITGETGTGKELIARAIHKRSRRSSHAFISVNCASIPPTLIASELFGHEKGAFTGAMQLRQGRFELAQSGTIFLDESGELPAETQIALLRVLQERQFERVGGTRVIPADVRVIAATNRDLPAAVAAGTFRADLFYRINVFPIQVPPLRERKKDIPMLVEYFLKRFAEKMGKPISKIDKHVLEVCQGYHWPGNIRELQNIIERSVILCGSDPFWIDEAWLSTQEPLQMELSAPLVQMLQNQEKKTIEAALVQSKEKVAGSDGAAARLRIPPSTLDSKIKQLKIEKHKFSSTS
ncbi:sigma 54-interacting transcriptional regulator [Edaphobacter aggregans]|uniref:sigma 54-interacting transcriptional regulator n=1 Tax=Edaphobacter aggregans TaxID=570835 RepID=UPI0012F8BFD8|nr:sigma 54-interacting transcriptional regulator [Edaphobacter aggregans]